MSGRVNELTTAAYTAQLKDQNGDDISLSDIVSIALTLYETTTKSIINGRDNQNVLNANGVTISSTGAVSWVLDPEDNAVVVDSLDTEVHTALFQGVFAIDKEFKHDFSWRVVNLEKVS